MAAPAALLPVTVAVVVDGGAVVACPGVDGPDGIGQLAAAAG